MSFEDFKKAIERAIGLDLDGIVSGIGKGGRNVVSKREEMALVEIVAINAQDGIIVAPEYLGHPAHLPTNELELKVLRQSNASKDAGLRADLIEWAEVNREIEMRHSRNLQTSIEAMRKAATLLAEEGEEDAAEDYYQKLDTWRVEIDAVTRRAYQCETREAPEDRIELTAWCVSQVAALNPCPRWLYESSSAFTRKGSVFTPAKKTGRHLDVIEGGRGRKGDDDDD